jgi:hypothetical protein
MNLLRREPVERLRFRIARVRLCGRMQLHAEEKDVRLEDINLLNRDVFAKGVPHEWFTVRSHRRAA